MYVAPLRPVTSAVGGLAIGVEAARGVDNGVLPATGISIVPLVILGMLLILVGLALLRTAAVRVLNRRGA